MIKINGEIEKKTVLCIISGKKMGKKTVLSVIFWKNFGKKN